MTTTGNRIKNCSSSGKNDFDTVRSRFVTIRQLGEGGYGKVHLAVERKSGEKYAIKVLRKQAIGSSQNLIKIHKEFSILTALDHPNIIKVHQVIESSKELVVVMEHASGGELYDYILERNGLDDHEARRFFRQIVSAVAYLHQNGIVHRDLKLENILLDRKENVKLVDFGMANLCGFGVLLKTFCGSPLYSSPEIINGRPYCGPEVDCWSLGVVLYAMIFESMPFNDGDFKQLQRQITAGDFNKPTRQSDALHLISLLLDPDPATRATISDIRHDSWLNFGYFGRSVDDEAGCPVDLDSLRATIKAGRLSQSDEVTKVELSAEGSLENERSNGELTELSEDVYYTDESLYKLKGRTSLNPTTGITWPLSDSGCEASVVFSNDDTDDDDVDDDTEEEDDEDDDKFVEQCDDSEYNLDDIEEVLGDGKLDSDATSECNSDDGFRSEKELISIECEGKEVYEEADYGDLSRDRKYSNDVVSSNSHSYLSYVADYVPSCVIL